MTNTLPDSIIHRVACEDEECGQWSIVELFADGSHRLVLSGCWHAKRMPTRAKIKHLIAQESASRECASG